MKYEPIHLASEPRSAGEVRGIRIDIPGDPVPWARARRCGNRYFIDEKQAVARETIAALGKAAMQGRKPLSCPLEVSIMCVCAWPKSYSERKRKTAGSHHKTTKSDVDNYLKLPLDALNQIVWTDDAIIARAVIEKQYGMTPMTVIRVEPLCGETT